MALLSAHHFVLYAREVAEELERECAGLQPAEFTLDEREAPVLGAQPLACDG
jgi:hypothetical protein